MSKVKETFDDDEDPELTLELQYYLESIQKMNNSSQYYYGGEKEPPLSDSAWDTLFRAIKKFEKKHPDQIVKYSPTQAIQVNVNAKPTVEHDFPALSIENIYDLDDSLMNFLKRLAPVCKNEHGNMEIYVEPKYDGCAISLTYKPDGTLNYVATRGNGKRGYLVTDNFLKIINSPEHYINLFKGLEEPDVVTLRGELIMYKTDFNRLNDSDDGKKRSNPRNTVSGLLNTKKLSTLEGVRCFFMPYDIFRDESKNIMDEEDSKEYNDLRYYWKNFRGGPWRVNVTADAEKCINIVRIKIEELMARKNKMAYCMDGVVVKIYDKVDRAEIGETELHPKWAIAYKQKDTLYKTKVLSMRYTVGKLGVITPVITFDETVIGGVFTKNATMYNYSKFKKMNLRYGDEVLVKRSAEVIPKVVRKVTGEKENTKNEHIKFPTKCPACGEPLELTKNGINYFCHNPTCKGRLLAALISAVDRKHLNIYSLGEANVNTLFNAGFLKDIPSLFKLRKHEKKIRDLFGFNIISTDNILNMIDSSIERCKKEPYRLLSSYPINLLGPGVAKTILTKMTLDTLIDVVEKKDFPQFQLCFGKMQALFMSLVKNIDQLKECSQLFKDFGVEINTTKTYKNTIRGKIAISGEIKGFDNREDVVKAIEEIDFISQSNVNKNTSFLLTNPENTSKKVDKANDLEIPVIYSLEEIQNYYKSFETGEKV